MGKADLHVLALNSGSSSLKFGLFRAHGCDAQPWVTGEAEAVGSSAGLLRVRDAHGALIREQCVPIADGVQAFRRIARAIADLDVPAPDALGHRVVHGGARLQAHARIDAEVLAQLEAACAFAPLHVPAALAVIRAAQARFPDLPQVACLDTAFHAGLPEEARTLPVDRALQADGLRRYGFHGLSCASIVAHWRDALPQRMVIAHLGSGASVTALRDGRPVDTSMGMTPNGGVMMGTRCGDLDPGVLIWLAREKGFDVRALERLVDHRSGLLGVSGTSADLRRLRKAARTDPLARLAIRMFALSVRKQIVAMAAVLEGIDALVFTGGIGEHDAATRWEICEGLAWAGIALDAERNHAGSGSIQRRGARCQVLVIGTEEERQICRYVHEVLAGSGH